MINFDRLDLNLLRVFDAVMEERSVIKAGHRLHLSQSAVSHALTRLREGLGEELFVRTGKGMTPTAFALKISDPLRKALRSMSTTLVLAASEFDAASIKRSFVVAANDYVSAILIPEFNGSLSKLAPGIDLVIRPSTRIDLAEQIDLGRIDIAIGIFRSIPERLRSTVLMHQDEVLLVWNKHPLAEREVMLRDIATFSIAVVSLGGQQDGAISGFILERGLARQSEMYDRSALENALQGIGEQPRLQTTIPHFLVIPMLLEDSELISIVPRPLATTLCKRYPLAVKELPYATTPQRLDAVWHSNNDADPAHSWLRARLSETVRNIDTKLGINAETERILMSALR
jgi:DNA-binding transcriptional LysR family regulator